MRAATTAQVNTNGTPKLLGLGGSFAASAGRPLPGFLEGSDKEFLVNQLCKPLLLPSECHLLPFKEAEPNIRPGR